MKEENRDHVFINYAIEDFDFAEWLSLKLIQEGYAVWMDKIKLLGGESYPNEIDDAINNRSYTFISILSNKSLKKPNPRKERTKALNLLRSGRTNFIVPLNLNLQADELPWDFSDLSYVSFKENWAEGYFHLVKRLKSLKVPKSKSDPNQSIYEYLNQKKFVEVKDETVYSNIIKVEKIPKILKMFKFGKWITRYDPEDLSSKWAFYRIKKDFAFSFTLPPVDFRDDYEIDKIDEFEVDKEDKIHNIPVENIIKNLIKRSIEVYLSDKGLQKNDKNLYYFPHNLLEKNKIKYKNYKGKSTQVQVSGLRSPKIIGYYEPFHYHLSPNFIIKKDSNDYYILLNIYLHITDVDYNDITDSKTNTMRKKVRKSWHNKEILNRIMGIVSFLKDEKEEIKIGSDNNSIIINPELVHLSSNKSINESVRKEIIEEPEIYYGEEEDKIEVGGSN